MKIIKNCTECGNKAPVYKGIGTRYWCKNCAHLAPETPVPTTQPVDDGRPRIKFTLGEEKNESKKPETRRI